MKPTKVIATAIDLAHAIESARPDCPGGFDLAAVTPDMLQYTPEEVRLREFLSLQPAGLIYGMLQVMYLGRGDFDDDRDFLGVYEYVSDTFRKPEYAISQMIEKTPLAKYLSDGLEKANNLGLDLDEFLGG